LAKEFRCCKKKFSTSAFCAVSEKTRTEDEGVDIESMNRQRVWEKEDESETFF
jgi:hypothetical protein